jgi:hypothetical protein
MTLRHVRFGVVVGTITFPAVVRGIFAGRSGGLVSYRLMLRLRIGLMRFGLMLRFGVGLVRFGHGRFGIVVRTITFPILAVFGLVSYRLILRFGVGLVRFGLILRFGVGLVRYRLVLRFGIGLVRFGHGRFGIVIGTITFPMLAFGLGSMRHWLGRLRLGMISGCGIVRCGIVRYRLVSFGFGIGPFFTVRGGAVEAAIGAVTLEVVACIRGGNVY